MKISDMIGRPIVFIQESLPEKACNTNQKAVDKSLNTALSLALKTIDTIKQIDFDRSIRPQNLLERDLLKHCCF